MQKNPISLKKTLDLYELRVVEVMRPASDMILINKNDTVDALLEQVKQYRYSRYPVYDPEENDIIGILHVKDIFATKETLKAQTVNEFIRPVLKVPFHLPVNNLLRRFREGMPHFALVYDGNKKLLGFITLDNVLHVLLGIIKDEFNRTQVDWVFNKDGTISATGFCSIYSLEQALDKDIEVDENIETLAGLILHHLGRLPEEGERLYFDAFDAKVEKVQGTRILNIAVYPKTPKN
ncbi:CBS domain-containing protein [Legionella israelensis]|uniref:CBS domain-containing protein n=1 Tax=Legionella israelensis TaxID=454 RepID=A0AAX1EF79_9GAMM|nr:CBS domain-containing protein [Legionella israelensis]QBR83756.1 CBS domain-containing protein [Legionella israelensis]